MYCHHRFLNFHQNSNGRELFPDWKVKYLFIGTFNPSWNNPNGNNACYFYERSRYFWRVLPRFFNSSSLENTLITEKISFCKRHGIGFTDLIKGVNNVDFFNEHHQELIVNFRDEALLEFAEDLDFNTGNIIQYILNSQSISRIYFTLLANNPNLINAAINEIEIEFQNNPQINTHRIHTPTGMGLGNGKPKENNLLNRWFGQGLNHISPNLNLEIYPFY